MTDLDGRVVAVAGAAGGLGPAVVERLAADGATLALADVDADRATQVAKDAGLPEDRFDARAVDLLDPDAAATWAGDLSERFGKVDALAHLVGGWRGGDPLATFDLADYELLHNLLVKTVINATRAFHDLLANSEAGRFVLVSSSAAQNPEGTNSAYAATKASAEAWTLALADSLAESGSTANIVVVNAIGDEDPEHTPAADIAAAIAFLLSESGAKMNGQRLSLHQ